MALKWYLNRLAAMSGREVVYRVGEQIKRSRSRRRRYGWDAFPPVGQVIPIPGLADQLRRGMDPPLESALRASVDAILAGRYSAHGVRWPERHPGALFPPALWRLDPVSGKLWPGTDIFCFDVGYRHSQQVGDIKLIWDIHRLQFLQPLAAAVALWGDRRAAEAIAAAIASWGPASPPFGGLVWNSGVELSLRVVSLAVVASLCGTALGPQTDEWIGRILSAHLYWLRRYPSRFSSANNHRVSEALAELTIASVLPSLPTSPRVARQARETLERECQLQILADGAPAEQSPTYGAFTAEMLLVADMVAGGFGQPMSAAFAARLAAYADFVGALGDANGRVPNIGDDDEVRVLTLRGTREHAYPASIARSIAGRYAIVPRVPSSQDGPELRDAFFRPALATQGPADGLRTFQDGGYTVVRGRLAGRSMRLVIDHGPLGYLSIAAHGHADANAITLSLDDRDVLVDPGTYLYHPGGVWRDWFRGTGAHSTVRVGGVDQSLISGSFNWSHKAHAVLDSVCFGDTGAAWSIRARHDGYLKRFGVEHHRTIAAAAAGLVIEDKLVGRPIEGVAEVIFQLAPGLTVTGEGLHRRVAGPEGTMAEVAFSHPGTISAMTGGDTPGPGGWVSEGFGDKVAAARLVWSGVIPPEGLRTTWSWAKGEPEGAPETTG